jgi:hypothetical protein
MVISRIGVLSCGKVMGALYGLMGLLFGAFFALISLLGVGAAMAGSDSGDTPMPFLGAIFGVGAIVLFPLCYGILGFVGGLITAAIYNLVSGIVGGLEIEAR